MRFSLEFSLQQLISLGKNFKAAHSSRSPGLSGRMFEKSRVSGAKEARNGAFSASLPLSGAP
jgi:hypothetical protein